MKSNQKNKVRTQIRKAVGQGKFEGGKKKEHENTGLSRKIPRNKKRLWGKTINEIRPHLMKRF